MVGIPILLIATSCQDNIGDVWSSLGHKKQQPLVLLCVLSLVFCVYLIVGQFGCLLLHSVPNNLLLDPAFPKTPAGYIVSSISAVYSMAATLICDIPFLVYPSNRVLFPLLFNQNYKNSTLIKRSIVTICKRYLVILLSAGGFSLLLKVYFLQVMSIVGILSCVYISTTLPCLLYLKGGPKDDPKWMRWGSAGVLGVSVVVGCIAFGYMIAHLCEG